MAEVEQMFGRAKGGLFIVDDHGRQVAARNAFAGNDHGRDDPARGVGQRCGQATIEQDHRIGLIAAQIGGIGGLAFGFVLGVADQDVISGLAGTLFDSR